MPDNITRLFLFITSTQGYYLFTKSKKNRTIIQLCIKQEIFLIMKMMIASTNISDKKISFALESRVQKIYYFI